MFNDNTAYDTDYKDKFKLFTELVASRLGPATPQDSLRQKLSRIQTRGDAANTLPLVSDMPMQLDNVLVVTVRAEAVVNQVYIDLDNIELILADGTIQEEFFSKLSGITSTVYTVTEKQVDNLGLLFRFLK